MPGILLCLVKIYIQNMSITTMDLKNQSYAKAYINRMHIENPEKFNFLPNSKKQILIPKIKNTIKKIELDKKIELI